MQHCLFLFKPFPFKYLGLLIWLLGATATICKAENRSIDIKQIRKLLVLAVDQSETTDSLYSSLNGLSEKTPLIVGYLAALQALKAKHAWNPYRKLQYLNQSKKEFKKAIAADGVNIEIRFMRFSVQHNLPGFLGQSENLKEDREVILAQLDNRNYGTADKNLTKTIMSFLLDSKRCTPSETEKLKSQLAAYK